MFITSVMKVATLNVKRTSESSRLTTFISSLDVDVIMFQEATQSTTKQVSVQLEMNYVMYRGLAVLSKHIIQKLDTLDLGRMWKGALKVRVMKRTISVVHLEHEYENIRYEQIGKLESFIDDCDIVAGDFNDIYLEEYTEDEISTLESSRREVGLKPMTGRVMRKFVTYGFTIGDRIGNTTPYHTRVDYITFKNHNVLDNQLIDCIKTGLSDHNMVYMTLKRK